MVTTALSTDVRTGDPGAKVIAGSTAPTGTDGVCWTSPQPFARVLADGGAAKYFDVYSRYPSVPRGTSTMDQRLSLRHSDHTVSLSNIGRLLWDLYTEAVRVDRSVRGNPHHYRTYAGSAGDVMFEARGGANAGVEVKAAVSLGARGTGRRIAQPTISRRLLRYVRAGFRARRPLRVALAPWT